MYQTIRSLGSSTQSGSTISSYSGHSIRLPYDDNACEKVSEPSVKGTLYHKERFVSSIIVITSKPFIKPPSRRCNVRNPQATHFRNYHSHTTDVKMATDPSIFQNSIFVHTVDIFLLEPWEESDCVGITGIDFIRVDEQNNEVVFNVPIDSISLMSNAYYALPVDSIRNINALFRIVYPISEERNQIHVYL